MRIGLDVMGGDNAPDAILEGAIGSLSTLGKDDEIVLVISSASRVPGSADHRPVDSLPNVTSPACE